MKPSNKKGKNKPKIEKAPLVILTNERSPAKADLLTMLYSAFSKGQVGLVDGMDPDTGEVTPMLAGIEMTDGELTGVYPLASIFQSLEEVARILIPDGQGNYVSTNANLTELDDGPAEPEAKAEGGQALEQGTSED